MLIRFKKSFEKIAMGLLSFMPEAKDVKKLQDIIKEYENNQDWHLYLWKEGEDIIGAAGVRVNEREAIIQHVSVNPSHRNSGIGRKMVEKVRDKYQGSYSVCATEETEAFIEKCNKAK
ncbi:MULTISPECIES: GNAT family N-acetyltransferase [Salimicrobium]|uniref:N-acetyltransferase n=1 Tax=Salimicrobium humidisoli TaxID=2029857 RepID=A0ABX4HQK4_9BACI|nr:MULTISPECIES: GNAT family N-acetyltransferase [Salimicrobium]PBB05498.1 N-acetyltransferase [Salimicrobium humidisoli]